MECATTPESARPATPKNARSRRAAPYTRADPLPQMKKYLVEFIGTFFLVFTVGSTVIAPGAGRPRPPGDRRLAHGHGLRRRPRLRRPFQPRGHALGLDPRQVRHQGRRPLLDRADRGRVRRGLDRPQDQDAGRRAAARARRVEARVRRRVPLHVRPVLGRAQRRDLQGDGRELVLRARDRHDGHDGALRGRAASRAARSTPPWRPGSPSWASRSGATTGSCSAGEVAGAVAAATAYKVVNGAD